jgi:PAS domain S-box-containing protein
MTSTARIRPLLRSVPGIVSVACLLGAMSLVGVVALPDVTAINVGLGRPWLIVVLLVATVVGELTAVRLRHGNEVEELTLFEAAVLADALLLRPVEAITVTLVGLLLASAATRRPWVKSLFNAGTYAVATAALLACVVGLSDPTRPFGAGTVAGLLLGTAVFGVVNLLGLSVVLAAATGVPARVTLKEGWRISVLMAFGTAGIGATTVAMGRSAPLLLPFTLLPAAALTYAYAAVAHESEQRLRSQQLLELGHLLAGPVEVEDLITRFLAYVRETFRAETAFIVMESAGREETVVIAHEAGVDIRWAASTERLLLATTDSTNLLADVDLPLGRRRVLASPLEAENRRLGVLALTEPLPQRTLLSAIPGASRLGRQDRRLGATEQTLVGPLAAALAAALRGAEHLARSQDETAKLKAVVEDSSDGIVVLDPEGCVTLWNPSVQALTGRSEAEALGHPLGELVELTDTAGSAVDPVAHAWERLTPATPRLTFETALNRPDGEQRWVRWAHAAVFDSAPSDGDSGDEPQLLRDVVLVHDITREHQVDRLKQDFLATVSHELRSPLTPIKGYVELLRRKGEDFTPEKRGECLDVVNDRVAHLARLVEDVLLASRVTVPSSTVQMGTGDLVALARKTTGDFAVESARMHLDLPQHIIPVECDPVRVVQVLSNLVSNALKYSPSTSPVFIVVRADQGTARLSVTDQGRGIPTDQLEAIFEKFHRVEDPMRMTTGGTGLGLFIAKQLTEAMGGSLVVTSAYGIGSTFTFSLPLKVEEESSGQDEQSWPNRRFTRASFPAPRRGDPAVDNRST